jgi:hypothetical protein
MPKKRVTTENPSFPLIPAKAEVAEKSFSPAHSRESGNPDLRFA